MKASEQDTSTGAPGPLDDAQSITQDEIEQLLEEEQMEDDDISLGETFDILRNRRRRDVLLYLFDVDDNSTTLSELAEHVAAKENDIDRSELSSTQRKRVYIGLYQCHLPKMDDLGVIDYDQDRGTVVLKDSSMVLSYLPEATDDAAERPLGLLYAAVLVTAVLTVGLLGLGATAAVPTPAWAVLSAGVLAAVGLFITRQ